MRNVTLNRKGMAILLVSILILVAVPVIMVMFNLSSSQKEQTLYFNQKLNVEQISLSGINLGNSKLKKNSYRPKNPDYLTKEVSGNDRFDLSVNRTGTGFFNQDIYMVLSKSEEDKQSSIILADAEQFQQEKDDDEAVLVITHDYWTTSEPYEISVMRDIQSIKNERGKDQLRSLKIKKYELESDQEKYRQALTNIGNSLPSELQKCWDTVMKNLDDDKIATLPKPGGSSGNGGNKNNNNNNNGEKQGKPVETATPSDPGTEPDSGIDPGTKPGEGSGSNNDQNVSKPCVETDIDTNTDNGNNDSTQQYDDRGFPLNNNESKTGNKKGGTGADFNSEGSRQVQEGVDRAIDYQNGMSDEG